MDRAAAADKRPERRSPRSRIWSNLDIAACPEGPTRIGMTRAKSRRSRAWPTRAALRWFGAFGGSSPGLRFIQGLPVGSGPARSRARGARVRASRLARRN